MRGANAQAKLLGDLLLAAPGQQQVQGGPLRPRAGLPSHGDVAAKQHPPVEPAQPSHCLRCPGLILRREPPLLQSGSEVVEAEAHLYVRIDRAVRPDAVLDLLAPVIDLVVLGLRERVPVQQDAVVQPRRALRAAGLHEVDGRLTQVHGVKLLPVGQEVARRLQLLGGRVGKYDVAHPPAAAKVARG